MNKTLSVTCEYRENPLSLRTGGKTVCVKYKNVSTIYKYNNVKNTEAFIRKTKINHGDRLERAWVI